MWIATNQSGVCGCLCLWCGVVSYNIGCPAIFSEGSPVPRLVVLCKELGSLTLVTFLLLPHGAAAAALRFTAAGGDGAGLWPGPHR
jgi:hypothetical protein